MEPPNPDRYEKDSNYSKIINNGEEENSINKNIFIQECDEEKDMEYDVNKEDEDKDMEYELPKDKKVNKNI